MKRVLSFLFGKPFKKDARFVSKYLRFSYWSMAVIYFIIMCLSIVNAFLAPETIVGFVIAAIFYPVIFRFIHRAIGSAYQLEREQD
ncbi:hypothetical protein KO561_17630 [Radiobacillus kanasensis]|uniref:hypothetical protein n=1 Tax=Radiobacillus kanasensis TaxID=2844358 RepID=UPI001E2C4D80|nr:hypothetical protein [Radiobacillus kanasensis]UFT98986.1 hypothetical protein KO561_17630 [Radiobacillus kanasensis]